MPKILWCLKHCLLLICSFDRVVGTVFGAPPPGPDISVDGGEVSIELSGLMEGQRMELPLVFKTGESWPKDWSAVEVVSGCSCVRLTVDKVPKGNECNAILLVSPKENETKQRIDVFDRTGQQSVLLKSIIVTAKSKSPVTLDKMILSSDLISKGEQLLITPSEGVTVLSVKVLGTPSQSIETVGENNENGGKYVLTDLQPKECYLPLLVEMEMDGEKFAITRTLRVESPASTRFVPTKVQLNLEDRLLRGQCLLIDRNLTTDLKFVLSLPGGQKIDISQEFVTLRKIANAKFLVTVEISIDELSTEKIRSPLSLSVERRDKPDQTLSSISLYFNSKE